MKKHQLLALVGTLALLVNLLVPGLSLAADPTQTGTADLGCSATAPAFSLTPGAAFDFTADGAGAPLTASIDAQYAYKDPAAADLSVANGTDFIEVNDVRDPSTADCNNGITLQLATTGTFDGAVTAVPIPLANVKVVSSNDACPATSTAKGTGICFDNAARCGLGDGTPTALCSGANGGSVTANYNGQDFTTWASYTVTMAATRDLMTFVDTAELYGKAGLATSFAVNIPAGQAADTYTLPMQYSIVVNP